jgi:hypothetical protein
MRKEVKIINAKITPYHKANGRGRKLVLERRMGNT